VTEGKSCREINNVVEVEGNKRANSVLGRGLEVLADTGQPGEVGECGDEVGDDDSSPDLRVAP